MDITYKRAFDIVTRYCLNGEYDVSQIPYNPGKTVSSFRQSPSAKLPRTTPESAGISSLYISDFLTELEENLSANIHSLIIAVGGRVICDVSAPGYDSGRWHQTFSMCKSLTGLAVGMLIDDGKLSLSSRLADFFPKTDGKLKNITVKNLLTMTACVSFSEIGAITTDNWTEMFLTSDLKYPVGSKFCYNSMNSYILSVIVSKVCGKDMLDFLTERLFAPLGIKNVMWEKSPEGFSKGGWGLYISTEDCVKIGVMCANGGVYEGRRIISEEYLCEATSTQTENPKEDSEYNYGYHIWSNRNGRSCLFNGMFGQNVWICPESKIVIAVNSGNNELFQRSALLACVARYFDPSVFTVSPPLRNNRKSYKKLKKTEKNFFFSRTYTEHRNPPSFLQKLHSFFGRIKMSPIPEDAEKHLLNRRFDISPTNAGILPLFTRLVQNNFSHPVSGVVFTPVNGDALVSVFTAGDTEYRITAGLFGYTENEIDINGEKYTLSARAEFTYSEERERMLKLDFVFPELASSRRIALYYGYPDRIRIVFDEIPGKKMIASLLDSVSGSLPRAFTWLSIIKPQFNISLVKNAVLTSFAPTVFAVPHADPIPMLPPSESVSETEKTEAPEETAEIQPAEQPQP